MIEATNLSKKYGPFEAVKGVSFTVGQDQVLGLLGPNGAGKTTIMKILTGYHFPSGGTALVDGISVTEDPVEVKKRIGYLPEGVPLYGDLTPEEYLTFIADARGIAKPDRPEKVNRAIEACGLGHMRNRKIENLSKGYKQRVGLAQAIIHDPPVLILDEPTTGLDPNQIIEIRSLIKDLGKSKTVILSTHILQEVEAVCSQVMIINEGRIAAQGTTEEIAATMKGGETWEMTLKGASEDTLPEMMKPLEAAPSAVTREESGAISFTIHTDGLEGERIFDWAVSKGYKILRMNRKRLSLEDIFVKLTNEGEAAK
jgi:ABC-2 type transport system ATP-binding protein